MSEYFKIVKNELEALLEEKEANKEMKLIKRIADKKVLSSFIITIFILVTVFINLVSNSLDTIFSFINGNTKNPSLLFKIIIPNFSYIWLYFIAYLITGLCLLKLVFNIKASFSKLNDGQKGNSRFATIDEIRKQYKAVKETEVENNKNTFEGKGGIIVSREADEIFIDDSPTNNLIIGTSRSGKGELILFPTIDIYSRAKEKSSLILNDPKGELYSASKETLEDRGYRVEVLNLLKPMNSMSYNPLQLIIEAYKNGDYSTAQSLTKTLTYSLYYKPGVKDPFWQTSAMSLVNALILAVCEKCIKENNLEKITLYTVANMLSELGSKEDYNGENELDKFFNNLPKNSVAKMQYATSNFSKGTARGGIFATAMSELQIFTMDEIAKMTSKNSINLRDIGFINKNNNDNKPVALFMITPDYDCSNHVISSIFVRQLYYVLAKESSLNDGGKCDREVVFLLDEFGNMPSIEGMANIITVCLGRNIKFNLVIQAISQLKKLYGDDYKTILGNCSNKLYIFTNEVDTAEEYAKLLGDKTITTYSRSGEIFDITKHQTESIDMRKLLTVDELMHLEEGETVLVRGTKRQDLEKNNIRPYPIFNTGENKLKYRYRYLGKYFDTNKNLINKSNDDINILHKNINLENLLINWNGSENKVNEKSDEKINNENINAKKEELNDKTISEILTEDEISKINKDISLRTDDELQIDLNMDIEKVIQILKSFDIEEYKNHINIINERLKNFEVV